MTETHPSISVNPNICHGKPCFAGTRIMVSTVLELLESGKSAHEIHKGYPTVTKDHIRAALHFAHQVVNQSQFISHTIRGSAQERAQRIVSRTAGLLRGRVPTGVTYQRRLRRETS